MVFPGPCRCHTWRSAPGAGADPKLSHACFHGALVIGTETRMWRARWRAGTGSDEGTGSHRCSLQRAGSSGWKSRRELCSAWSSRAVPAAGPGRAPVLFCGFRLCSVGHRCPCDFLNAKLEDSRAQKSRCKNCRQEAQSWGGVGRPGSELTPVSREAVPGAGFGPVGPHPEPEGAGPGGLLGPFPWLNEEVGGAVT